MNGEPLGCFCALVSTGYKEESGTALLPDGEETCWKVNCGNFRLNKSTTVTFNGDYSVEALEGQSYKHFHLNMKRAVSSSFIFKSRCIISRVYSMSYCVFSKSTNMMRDMDLNAETLSKKSIFNCK